MAKGTTPRVVQWGTGRIGKVSLRELITSPQFDLVGVYVHSEEKEGADAGTLADLPPTGVAATRDLDRIIALRPDIVVANPEGANVDEVCRLLEAGINIASSRVDFLDPERMDQNVRARVESACLKGGASIHSTGSSPGFSSEMLPLAMLGMSRRMERVIVDEYADIPASCPDVQVVEGMGFGREETGEFNPHVLAHIAHGFEQSVSVVARTLGIKLDKQCEVRGETAKARERFLLPGGTPIEKGTVAAQRITVSGMVDGKPVITFRVNWYTTLDIDADWNLLANGWRVLVEGDTPLEATIGFPVDKDRGPTAMAGITAYRVINTVPHVIAAAPGIRTSSDLPLITPRIG